MVIPKCVMRQMLSHSFRYCLLFILFIGMAFCPLAVDTQVLPNDPFLPQQWGWFRIAADKAWEAGCNGAGIVVAVLDTGIDLDHPDLADNIVDGWNFIDNNGDASDLDNHGTMVSGVIAAIADNSEGLVGVAPDAKIMPLKVLDSDGGNPRDVASAIRYAADNGAKIITMSFGGQYGRLSISAERAIDYAARQGCILVAAVGNDNTDELVFPAAYEQVIAVSAIDQNDVRADFSNCGSYVEFCAPGINIVSTGKDGDYFMGNGTSFAAPLVAGLAALMLSDDPQLSGEEVRTKLRAQVEDLGEIGWDQYYGWGLANAYCLISENSIPEFSSWTPMLIMLVAVTVLIVIHKRRGYRTKSWT